MRQTATWEPGWAERLGGAGRGWNEEGRERGKGREVGAWGRRGERQMGEKLWEVEKARKREEVV